MSLEVLTHTHTHTHTQNQKDSLPSFWIPNCKYHNKFQPIAAAVEMIAQLSRQHLVSLIIVNLLSVELLDSVFMDRSVHKVETAPVSILLSWHQIY